MEHYGFTEYDQLLEKFEQASGEEFANDRMMLA